MSQFWTIPEPDALCVRRSIGQIEPNNFPNFLKRCSDLGIHPAVLAEFPKAARDNFYAGKSVVIVLASRPGEIIIIEPEKFLKKPLTPPE